MRINLIPSNPAADVSKPRLSSREMAFMTSAQSKIFLATAKTSRNYALFATAVGSGCRMGELLALNWTDFNFDAGTVDVRRSVSETGGKFIVKEPKSKAGRRTITLPKFALEALQVIVTADRSTATVAAAA